MTLKSVMRFHLPFASPSPEREEEFTEDMERAAVLCLSEAERDKGGLILKKAPEKLVYVAKVYYPFLMVPWRGRSLIFDGLNIASHTFLYDVLPDVHTFLSELKAIKTREAYVAFLSDRQNYFRDFKGGVEHTIEGLIMASPLLQDLALFLKEMRPVEAPMEDVVVLSPTLDEAAVEAALNEISSIRERLKEDVRNLRNIMRIVNNKTGEYIRSIHKDLQRARDRFAKDVKAVRSSVMEEIRQLQEKYDQEITKRSKKFEQQLKALQKELVKAEKTRERTLVEIERCKAEIESSRLRKDEPGEIRWRREMERYSSELSSLDKAIRALTERIGETERARDHEITDLRAEYNVEAEKVLARLREFEASFTAENNLLRREMRRLEELSSTILRQVDRLLELKRARLKEFSGIGIARKFEEWAIIHLPFYLACYEREERRRYLTHPPSIVEGIGAIAKLKGVFGAKRIRSILKPRSKAIADHLQFFLQLMERNPVFEKEVNAACMRVSLIRMRKFREPLMDGLKKLMDREWISEGEFKEISQLLLKRK